MSKNVFTVQEEKDFNYVEVAAELKNIRHVPVLQENGHLVGMVTIRDMLEHLSVAGASRFVPIREIMCRDVLTAAPETPVEDIAKLLMEREIGCVPIVDGTKLVGIISERDFVRMARDKGSA